MKILNKLLFRFLTLPRRIYCLVFGVRGRFHFSPKLRKKYCQGTIDYLNKREARGSVADIGCGLGDVLRHLDYKRRVGLDHYQNVLDSLSFLSRMTFWKGKIETSLYNLKEDQLNEKFDVIILLNLADRFDPDFLRQKIEFMYKTNLNPGGEIVFDIIFSDAPDSPYPYHHNVNFINANINADINTVGDYINDHMTVNGSRKVVSLKY